MSKTEILLLRHGESRGNVDKIFSGQVDVELTERGIAQAETAADFLLTQSIDVICSSDLSRAFNTAKAFSVRSGIDISYVSKNLRELDAGSLDGIPMAEIIEKYDDCVFDLSGGDSLIHTAIGAVSEKNSVSMHTVNVQKGSINIICDNNKPGRIYIFCI